MEKYTKLIVDCSTGTESVVDLTKEEMAEIASLALKSEQERLAQEAEAQRLADLKASAKAKLIAGEPLTVEEADTLVI